MEVSDLGTFRDKPWPEPQKGLAAMITHLDNGVGQLLDTLKQMGLENNTLVCFSSDNGPHKEGGNDPAFFHSSGGLRGIKRALYEGGIRVPFLARWPGHIPAGRTTDSVGWFADVLPTTCELAGAALPAKCDGVSLVATLTGLRGPEASSRALGFYEQVPHKRREVDGRAYANRWMESSNCMTCRLIRRNQRTWRAHSRS